MSLIIERSKIFTQVIDSCKFILKHDKIAASAKEYLDSRISQSLQDKYDFGFFPKDYNLQYLSSLVDISDLKKFNIIYNKHINNNLILSGHFSQHNLIMPFKDVHGNIVSILGRTLLSEAEQKDKAIQKYKYTIGADKELYVYGLNEAVPSILEKDYVICVEGQFDFIRCKEMGLDNVVALGWARLSKFQFFQISKYTTNIYLMLDNDDAGRKGKEMAKKRFKDYANIKTISIPKGFKDIDEFIKNNKNNKMCDIVINRLKNMHLS